MRRVWAAILVVLFSYPLIAPAFASGPDDAQLPACCRRNGKHHCAMMMEEMELGQLSSRFVTVQETCPYAPFARCPLMLPHSFTPPARRGFAQLTQGPALIVRAAEAGYRISADRTRHKRGPPRLLSL